MLSRELKELLNIQKKKVIREGELKNKLYQQVISKINVYGKQSLTKCVYTLPPFIYGYPPYDTEQMKEYLIKKLTADGFMAYLLPNGNLYVSWDIKDVGIVQSIK